MPFKFGENSERNLSEAHPALALVAREALSYDIIDMSVIEGHRNEVTQNEYYNADPPKSRVKWPNGKHNKIPSLAIDIVPYINGKLSWNKLHCCLMAGIILSAAAKLGIKIRWGGNWDMDAEPITDQDFQDLVHFELVKE